MAGPPRSADPQSKLRLAALTAVAAGVVLLAAAAFVLSYSGIHQVALQAGVSPSLAKLYPVIFDAMLVIAGAAAMALRGAGWWSRFYAWACLIALLAAVAIGDAVHATGTVLPERATRAAVAVTPWVLLLLAFGLLLTMLRYFRKARAAVAARQDARAAAAVDAGTGGQPGEATGGQPGEANGTAAGRAVVTWSAAGAAATAAAAEGRPLPPPRSSLDMLLGPKPGQAPAIEEPGKADAADTGTGDGSGQLGDPVSYGEETGYVHPDSYRDEGEYSPHGDSGGPGSNGGPGYPGQDEPAGDYDGPGGAPTDSPDAGNGVDGSQGPKEAEPQAVQADAAPGNGPAAAPGNGPAAAPGNGPAAAPANGPAAAPANGPAAAPANGPAAAPGNGPAAAPGNGPAAAPGDGPVEEHTGEHAGDDAGGETAADDGPGPERLRSTLESPGLERLRSTPTRPEE